jgi:hypothetical protein
MTDFYPDIRTIVTVFYFAMWYFKNIKPFSIWILIVVYIADYVFGIAMINLAKKALEKQ